MNYFKNRGTALGFAFSGLVQAFKSEPHIKIHAVATLAVVNLGFYFSVSVSEWLAILGCVALVLSLELVNSALEKLCDLVMPEQHPTIKYVKDVAAAAVLVACVLAAVVGVMVFWKYFAIFFSG